MKVIQTTTVTPYSPGEFGLMGHKRRAVRIYIADAKPPKDPSKAYKPLLPVIYQAAQESRHVPIWPEKMKVTWSESERAFILSGAGLLGYRIDVRVLNVRDHDEPVNATEADIAALNGSPLPRLG